MSQLRFATAVLLALLAAGCGDEEKNAVALPSGLRYVDQAEGTGEPAKMGDVVELHYIGRLKADGSKIDSSRDGNNPVEFQLGFVKEAVRGRVPGWDQGIVGMKAGGKRKLYVPPQFGYGPRGYRAGLVVIPPDAELVYEIELLQISGLQKDDLRKGSGNAAKKGDKVEVNYVGTFKSDGRQFDSSIARQQPFVFTIGRGEVIQGWEKGIVGMKVGGKRRLTVPWCLAYGENGKDRTIPPRADLVFDIELLSIK